MRLINANTLELEEFHDSELPQYAILSHTWEKEEMSFDDMNVKERPVKLGYTKIKFACEQACRESLGYIWVDTCCIDKRSSAELQECINSMYRYYSDAETCYVYLSDISDEYAIFEDHPMATAVFKESRWFTRGWTLQELIAPVHADFFSNGWKPLGRKTFLSDVISETTGIPPSILRHEASLSSVSVAQKMSWASYRRTTRIEDEAYSLLGIFGVNMPMLYGEGSKAFIRLQEEIIKISTDHSIFAWDVGPNCERDGSLLAASPSSFSSCGSIVQWGQPRSFALTNRGLQIWLQTRDVRERETDKLAILNCRYEDEFSGTLALRLLKYRDSDDYHVVRDSKLPASTSYLSNSRLAIVPVTGEALSEEPVLLQVTREFKPEASKLRIWITSLGSAFNIKDVYPQDLWDRSKRSMAVDDTLQVRGGATIETLNGEKCHIVFGWDKKSYEVKLNENDNFGVVLGVWASPKNSLYADQTLEQAVGRSNRYRDHSFSCFTGKCTCMTTSLTAYEPTQAAFIHVTVDIQKIMDEIVLVVAISVQTLCESSCDLGSPVLSTEANNHSLKQGLAIVLTPSDPAMNLSPCSLGNTESLQAYQRQMITDEYLRTSKYTTMTISRIGIWTWSPSYLSVKRPLPPNTEQILPYLLRSFELSDSSLGPFRFSTEKKNEIEVYVVKLPGASSLWKILVSFHTISQKSGSWYRKPFLEATGTITTRRSSVVTRDYARLSVFLPVEHMVLTVNFRELSSDPREHPTALLGIEIDDPGIGSKDSKTLPDSKVFEEMASDLWPDDLVPFEKYTQEMNRRLQNSSIPDPSNGYLLRPPVTQDLKTERSKSSK